MQIKKEVFVPTIKGWMEIEVEIEMMDGQIVIESGVTITLLGMR